MKKHWKYQFCPFPNLFMWYLNTYTLIAFHFIYFVALKLTKNFFAFFQFEIFCYCVFINQYIDYTTIEMESKLLLLLITYRRIENKASTV
jgi:hypothetical protein